MREHQELHLWNKAVVRVALLSEADAAEIMDACAAQNSSSLATALQKHEKFKLALEIAAPQFFDRLCQRIAKDSVDQGDTDTVVRYAMRASQRATPLGIFSSLGVVPVGSGDNFYAEGVQDSQVVVHRWTDFGNCNGEEPLFHLNPTASVVAGEYRYLEPADGGSDARYDLAMLDRTRELDIVFEALDGGQRRYTLAAVAQHLLERTEGNTLADCIAYVEELVEAKLLLPCRFIQALTERMPLPSNTVAYRDPALSIAVMSRQRQGLADSVEEAVQVNCVFESKNQSIDAGALRGLDAIIPFLKLFPPAPPAKLTQFIEKFQRKYEGASVPLLEVLDGAVGIGYGEWTPEGPEHPIFGKWSGFLRTGTGGVGINPSTVEWELWRLVQASAGEEIDLRDSPLLRRAAADAAAQTPPSLAVVTQLGHGANDGEVLLKVISGTPAGALISRFAADSDDLQALHNDICQAENKLFPGACVTELLYCPWDRRIGLVARPLRRPFATDIFGVAQEEAPEIRLQDLEVFVRDGQVHLWSRERGRHVIPVSTSAFNFRTAALGIYEFLCDVAASQFSTLVFDWGNIFPLIRNRPRVRVGKYIISPRQWSVSAHDCGQLIKAATCDDFREKLASVLRLERLPREIVLVEYDFALTFNLHDEFSIGVLQRTLHAGVGATFIEAFESRKAGAADGRVNETIFWMSSEKCQQQLPVPYVAGTSQNERSVELSYPPMLQGVISMEIVGNMREVDTMVRERLFTTMQAFEKPGAVNRWFFVRYSLPDWHLRLRIFVREPDRSFEVLKQVAAALALDDEKSPFTWRLVPYKPEYQRYGGVALIEKAEEVFHKHSSYVAAALSNLDRTEADRIRWLVAIESCAAVIRDFIAPGRRFDFIDTALAAMVASVAPPKSWRSTVGAVFRSWRRQIVAAANLNMDPLHESHRAGLLEYSYAVGHYAQAMNSDSQTVLVASSLCHMACNRVFPDAQNNYELLTFGLLRAAMMESVYERT